VPFIKECTWEHANIKELQNNCLWFCSLHPLRTLLLLHPYAHFKRQNVTTNSAPNVKGKIILNLPVLKVEKGITKNEIFIYVSKAHVY
jgi:hypothetical protein